MAQIHNELRKGYLSEACNRAVGRTREGGIERISETLDVVMNPWGMPEWAYLRQEGLWSFSRAIGAGGAATFAGVGICNTNAVNAAGYVVVVETLGVVAAAAADTADVYVGTDAVLQGLPSSASPILRDTRWRPLVTPVQPVIRYGSIALPAFTAGPLDSVQGTNVAFTYFQACLPFVLSPGQGIAVFSNNDASAMNVVGGGRTRKAYPGELGF